MSSLPIFVSGRPMQLAMRELRNMGKRRALISALVFGAVLGVTGPFGSQTALSPMVRYLFWMIMAFAGFGTAAVAQRALPSQSPSTGTLARIVAVAASSAVPMTFFVAWTLGVAQEGRTLSPVQLLALFPCVALVQLMIARLLISDDRMTLVETTEQIVQPPAYPPDFVAKLPANLRRDILALEAEDHYVRVHTLHGSGLILMRLADAVSYMDPRLGLRVHRSWWIAKDGVRALETTPPGRVIARLLDDTLVPISRTYLSRARTALKDQVSLVDMTDRSEVT